MERLIQVLDDVDDLLALLRHRCGWWPAVRPAQRDVRPPLTAPLRPVSP